MRILILVLLHGFIFIMLSSFHQKPHTATAEESEELKPFNDLMNSFMKKHKIPGGALAVTKDGRLIFARGFGYADVEAKIPVQPTSLFRIASLSKPITAVAVMQLIEKGLLKDSDKIADALQFQDHLPDSVRLHPDWQKITIAQLLTHTAGWDRSVDFDPMLFSKRIIEALHTSPPASPWDIITFMAPRPLQFEPGTKYVYSNFDYCLLGRIIEQKTRQDYQDYVKEAVFRPLGIHNSQIGKTLKEYRVDNEVCYYDSTEKCDGIVPPYVGQLVPCPYGAWYLEAMDAHGGWISSIIDLAHFLCTFDDFDNCPVLKRSSIEHMFFPPHPAQMDEKDVYYAYGWAVRKLENGGYNAWHAGLLAGTSSLMVHRHDGLKWVILFNAGRPGKKDGNYGNVIDPLVHRAAKQVKKWPTEDLFLEYNKLSDELRP
jgi:CubicO group peptidase (beta-lactamase class C family)